MIQEVIVWTSLICSIANIVPRLGTGPDMNDKARGHLVAAICQIVMTFWSIINVIYGMNITAVNYFVMSYYIYDVGHLLMNAYAKNDHIFIVHHMGTIAIILYQEYFNMPYYYFYNMMYVLLEGSGVMLNISGLAKTLVPYTKFSNMMMTTNMVTYGLTRVVLYPLVLLHLGYFITTENLSIYDIGVRIPPCLLLIALYIMSVKWYMVMTKNYIRLRITG